MGFVKTVKWGSVLRLLRSPLDKEDKYTQSPAPGRGNPTAQGAVAQAAGLESGRMAGRPELRYRVKEAAVVAVEMSNCPTKLNHRRIWLDQPFLLTRDAGLK